MCINFHVMRHEILFLQELIRPGPPLYSGKGKFTTKNGGNFPSYWKFPNGKLLAWTPPALCFVSNVDSVKMIAGGEG